MTLDLKERMKTWPFMVMIMSSASILISMVSFYFIMLHPSQSWREVLGIDLTLTQLSCPVLFATAAIFGALSVRGRAKLLSELSSEIESGAVLYVTLMEGIAEHASSSPAGPHT